MPSRISSEARRRLLQLADRLEAEALTIRQLLQATLAPGLPVIPAETIRRKVRDNQCLVCDQPAWFLGLCEQCRQEAIERIARGEVTEDDLVRHGLMLGRSQPAEKKNEDPILGMATVFEKAEQTRMLAERLAEQIEQSTPREKTGQTGRSNL